LLCVPQVFTISGNNISGTLPSLWARLTNLQLLDVANNKLSGTLPATYVSMQQLVVMDTSNNGLNGTIPSLWNFMAGPDFKLKCMVVFGNEGMQQADLNARKDDLGKASSGRLNVVTTSPPVDTPRWCGLKSFRDER
jgi:hypothetical protein